MKNFVAWLILVCIGAFFLQISLNSIFHFHHHLTFGELFLLIVGLRAAFVVIKGDL